MKFKTFICSIFSETNDSQFKRFISKLSDKHEVSEIWDNVSWDAPQEYINEMGKSLITKVIILQNPLILPDIIELKIYLMNEEVDSTKNNKRVLNLNPGYLSDNGMYLLTHKPNEWRGREKISEGIWQEKQYDFNEEFTVNRNTFSEYTNKERLRLFNNLYE